MKVVHAGGFAHKKARKIIVRGSCPYGLSDYSVYIIPAQAPIGRERHRTVSGRVLYAL